jgi:hypothetical protein
MFKFGKASEAEVAVRSRIGNAIGVYALPSWFDFDTACRCYKDLEYRYWEKFETKNWKLEIDEAGLTKEKLAVLYPLAIFNQMIDGSPEGEKLMIKVEERYNQYLH